ncbi:Retrovirus-related Pol polyprotein from transposon 17.6 [Araneus ventricosus]|uniref:Retrovirus-related Pol polyprotein from transposon 17.6 n=1 Tax=Araneus ventricosus TaxID=182803 RepID=A0A4Y2J5Q2_ARAVE|nr:Retrovirus-related Pol polyprotein from transposon 17.6 [Araneus ventricosus]
MLMDTGANATLLITDLAQNMKEQLNYTDPNISLKTATGEKQKYETNRMHPLNLVDPEKKEIRTGVEGIPVFSDSVQHSKSCSVWPKKRTIISVRSECLIQGVPEVPEQFRYDVTDFPSQVYQKGVLVAATLVDLEREAIAVRFLYLNNKPKILDKGAVIATCEPVVDIVACPQEFSGEQHLPSILDKLERLDEEHRTTESSGPLVSHILLVKEKDGSTRFCVDYRKLNEITKKVSYPLPRIDDTLDALNGSQWFTTLDLKSGYWKVVTRPEDREKAAFTTGQGLWQFKVMPFGLCNAPATIERLMETMLRVLSSEVCLVYIHDIIIVGRTFKEHLNNLRKVFQRLQKANLKLNHKECRFFQREVAYLGHVISAEEVKTDPEKIKALVDLPRPNKIHDLQSFLGQCTITVVL